MQMRLERLPQYIFSKLEEKKDEYLGKGNEIFDLSVGDPDFSTPEIFVHSLKNHLNNKANHHYPSFRGELSLRKEIARWYIENHNVELDPEKEILILIGAKEGIAHLPLALLNSGDVGLVPDPGYPAYNTAVILADGIPYKMPLLKENRFLPRYEDIPMEIVSKSKLMFLNYPNNPTAALADSSFFKNTAAFAEKNSLTVAHDFAYSEIMLNGKKAESFLSAPGAKSVGVEIHSFSKTYAMTGWRVGFVCGNSEVINRLAKVKSCMDSGVFIPLQKAIAEGMKNRESAEYRYMIDEYTERRDIISKGLKKSGFNFFIPEATYYLWVSIPERFGLKSMDFCEYLLEQTGVLVTPGIGFGDNGEDYFRIAINIDKEKIAEAVKRIARL